MSKPFANSFGIKEGGSDNWETPPEAVGILLPYIPKGSTILCPFDTAESEYVKVLGKENRVLHSHISEGIDFFDLPKPNVDYVISNPPYSKRTEVLSRLYEWGIPFALMCNSNGIYDSKRRFELAKSRGAQLMFIYPRTKYRLGTEQSSPPYMSVYWGYKFFPKDIMFARTDISLDGH